jgi:hypothetical protein
MTVNHLKMGVESIPETTCISYITQTMDSAQQSVPIMNQPLSQTFREPCNNRERKEMENFKQNSDNSMLGKKSHRGKENHGKKLRRRRSCGKIEIWKAWLTDKPLKVEVS